MSTSSRQINPILWETFDEFDGAQWVDVGINPYASVLKIPSENGELWKA